MKKKKSYKMNLDEKIYLLVFGKPKYKAEISRFIYGHEVKTVTRCVDNLKELKWIKSCPPPDENITRGGYYGANMEPLFDSIMGDLEERNISLTSTEKKSLRRYLDSKSFKDLVCEMTEENGRLRNDNVNFSMVKNQLVYLATYISFTTHLLDRRPIRASNFKKGMRLFTAPLFSLGTPLCEKLRNLDPYTSSVIYSSFDDMLTVADDFFGFKDYIPKLKKNVDIKKIRKPNTKTMEIRNEPGKDVCYKIIDK